MITKPKLKSKYHYIYMIRCKKNGKRYIGYTSRTPRIRFNEHVNKAIDNDPRPLYKDMRKYCNVKTCFAGHLRLGIFHRRARKIFKLTTLKKGTKYKETFNKEKSYIKKYNTYKKGYNQTING